MCTELINIVNNTGTIILSSDTLGENLLQSKKLNTMTHTYAKTSATVELLNDLLKINNDRIASYQLALEQSGNIERGLIEEFKKIVAEGIEYKEQLTQKTLELNGNATTGTTIFGKIYRAWTDLKVAFSGNTQKNILSSCQYNEEIALHTYNAALNQDVDMSEDIRRLIEEQESGLRRTYSQIKKHREARFAVHHSAMYFN